MSKLKIGPYCIPKRVGLFDPFIRSDHRATPKKDWKHVRGHALKFYFLWFNIELRLAHSIFARSAKIDENPAAIALGEHTLLLLLLI